MKLSVTNLPLSMGVVIPLHHVRHAFQASMLTGVPGSLRTASMEISQGTLQASSHLLTNANVSALPLKIVLRALLATCGLLELSSSSRTSRSKPSPSQRSCQKPTRHPPWTKWSPYSPPTALPETIKTTMRMASTASMTRMTQRTCSGRSRRLARAVSPSPRICSRGCICSRRWWALDSSTHCKRCLAIQQRCKSSKS